MSSSRGSNELGRRAFLKGAAAGAVGLGLSGGFARRLLAGEEEPSVEQVKTRVLGRTKVPVSIVAYGGGGLRPAAAHLRLLQTAVDHGLTFIDVAQAYGKGQAETAVGQFLSGSVDREKVFVSTKASHFRRPSGSSKVVYEALEKNVRESLERMQTDYVDLYQWPHGASSTAFLDDGAVREGLEKLKEKGLVRHLGVSSHANHVKVCEAVVKDGFYDVVFLVINVCTQNPDKAGEPTPGRRRRGRPILDTRGLLKAAKRKKVGVMAMKVANSGYLGDGTDDLLAEEFPADSPLSRHQKLYTCALRQDGLHTVVVGIRNALHLKEAIEIGSA